MDGVTDAKRAAAGGVAAPESRTARWRMCPTFVLRHAGMPFEWLEQLGFSDAVINAADAVIDGDTERRARQRFEMVYADERAALRVRFHALARHDDVRGAIFLSNPGMYEGMLVGYLSRDAVPDTSRFRRVERQVYTYLQRFCAKNETTSTFGPMGYGDVGAGDDLRVVRGASTRRRTFMARWALEAIAAAIARDPMLAVHVPLQRNVLVDAARVEETATGEALAAWESLGAGPATLAELARRQATPPGALLPVLRPLMERGAVVRRLDFPAETADGLAELLAALRRMPDAAARRGWEEALSSLAADFERFAAGDLDTRRTLLYEIERRFTALTGRESRRGAGHVYADRLVLFEEASSPLRIELGAGLARRIEQAVAPALDLSAHFGTQVQSRFRARAAAIVAQAGGRLDLLTYAERTQPDREFGSRFVPHDDILTVAGDSDVTLPPPEPESVQPDERYALPDLCLLGATPEAVARSPRVLVARVHHHLLLEGWLTTFAPAPERFAAQVAEWLDGTATGRQTLGLATSRRNKGFYRFPGARVLLTPTDVEGRGNTVAATSLRVVASDGGVQLVHPTRGPMYLYAQLADLTTYPPIAALAAGLVLHAPVRSRTDRLGEVHVGDAIYQRRSWELDASGVASAREADAFLALRRLVRARGLPRFVFLRVPDERKPYLIDTRSPFGAELLRHVGGRGVCHAEEMLPGPDDLWLADERGHYTCELRVQFLRLSHG